MTHQRRRIGTSDLSVFPLSLGGNVFGWTADESTSYAVLDAYVEGGGNFIDTADSYSFWAPGNAGGESEGIIGRWLAARGHRDDMVIATKVSQLPEFQGIAPETVVAGAEASLRRLGIEVIDLYYAHFDQPELPLDDTVAAFSSLVDVGKVRHIGISNFSPQRIAEWLSIAANNGLHAPVALQPQYSLMERAIEADLVPLAIEQELGVMPYYSLARGFLTGKYAGGAVVDSPRAAVASGYLDERGNKVLGVLSQIADGHGVASASIALAWLASRPSVVAPTASARVPGQLIDLLASTRVSLSQDEIEALTRASDLV